MKKCGVLLPVFSLPNDDGIGNFGESAYKFIDFLAECKQDFWQVLPLQTADYSGSPYQSDSAFAIDFAYVAADALIEKGLIGDGEAVRIENSGRVKRAEKERTEMLRKAFARFSENPPKDFDDYCKEESYWLDDYALFLAVGKSEGKADFREWKEEYSGRDETALESFATAHAYDIDFYKFTQYTLDLQWAALKAYANERGIKLIGDMPMYVSDSGADVWAHPEIFRLDSSRRPTLVAGVPPDAFTEDGQLWGNPVYDIAALEKSGYAWWLDRFKRAAKHFDVIRLDHFRGFESFYAVEAGAKNARVGEWLAGLGAPFFDAVKENYPELEIIAEDLGVITDDVRELIAHTGYPNMKVLQFGFGGGEENDHNPANYSENCVAYTGTHDNDTCMGWYGSLRFSEKRAVKRELKKRPFENIADAMIRNLIGSRAKYAIVPLQDYMRLNREARINLPGSVGAYNWSYRLRALPDAKIGKHIAKLCVGR